MRMVTSRSSPPFSRLQLAGDQLLDEVGRQQALELGARLGLGLDVLGQPRVLDGDRRLRSRSTVKICRSFSVNALVAICESMCMMPSSSSAWSSGTHMVERMPCMMIECAPEKRESIVASDDEHRALVLLDLVRDRLRQHDLLVVRLPLLCLT